MKPLLVHIEPLAVALGITPRAVRLREHAGTLPHMDPDARACWRLADLIFALSPDQLCALAEAAQLSASDFDQASKVCAAEAMARAEQMRDQYRAGQQPRPRQAPEGGLTLDEIVFASVAANESAARLGSLTSLLAGNRTQTARTRRTISM